MHPEFESEQFEQPVNKLETASAESRLKDATSISDKAGSVQNVELNRITANDIQSSADFNQPEQYASLRHEAAMLKQMQPAIAQGADVETFHDWDKANHIGHYSSGQYVRGYADVYHSYYDGAETVAVTAKPDGTYDVINGRHRIVAARDAGLTHIPAQVLR
jgi:hypothetical protein